MEVRLGSFTPAAPVVLAPMAGVTNAPFRALCRRYGPGLVYVNEMVMATALVHGNAKTEQMVTFGPDEQPRSLQLYGSDPEMMARAVASLCDRGLVDHIDLNFGCPAAKVTRRGGGAAVPAKPALLRAIVRAAVTTAAPYGVPVTAKFRMGLHDDLLTHLRAGAVCEDEGVAYIAMHARTAEQHYAGDARWDAIGELKAHVTTIPVLGNGDIWVAADALAMMLATGCDGVVVGRGCLGRPWLFGDLLAAFAGRPVPPPPPLGDVVDVMAAHAIDLVEHLGSEHNGDARLPQAHGVVPHRLSGRARGAPPAGDGVVARRARRPARGARPRARPSSPVASRSAAATPTARSVSPCRTASSTTSSPCPTTPTCSPSPAAEPTPSECFRAGRVDT